MKELVEIGAGLVLVFGGLKIKGKVGLATVVLGATLVVVRVAILAYKLTGHYE